MHKVPDVTGFRKYSKRKFRSVRLRKKQVSTLEKAYYRLSKKYRCWLAHASVTGDIPDVEWWMYCIDMIARTMKIANMDKSEFYQPYKDDNTPTRQLEKLIEDQKTKSS